MPIIRPSRAQDLPEICSIYAHHVTTGTGTFELTSPTLAELATRREDVISKGLPYLVAVDDAQVLGFAYCNWFKPRPAYRYSAEDSIYMAPNSQRRGLGRALIAELARKAQEAGVRKLIAVIGDSNNMASIQVHRSAGFTPVGMLRSCGWKFDRWLDVVLMEKTLGLGDTCPPQPLPDKPYTQS